MSITIRDIARKAGVSTSTVSRVLNKRPDISAEARERVMAAAQDLNYTINLHARALTGATSKTIGLIVVDSSTEFHSIVMRAVQDTVTPRGYSAIVCNTDNSPDLERQAYRILREKRVDGILVNSILTGTAPLQRLADENIPFVLLNRFSPDVVADCVRVDITRGAYLATRHLLELGHRQIINQTGSIKHPPSHDRVDGYRRALEEHGVPFDARLVFFSEGGIPASMDALRTALSQSEPRPTAVLAFNDMWAIGVYKVLCGLGLSVPDDVSVAGQIELKFSPLLSPPLTTVEQQVYDSGRLSAEILLQKLSWPDDEPWTPQTIVLEPKLVVRASSAEPRLAVVAGG